MPLFVWSLHELQDPASPWGEVADISYPSDLRRAVERVRDALSSQRIAWVAADPLTALHLDADPHCGIAPLVRPAL